MLEKDRLEERRAEELAKYEAQFAKCVERIWVPGMNCKSVPKPIEGRLGFEFHVENAGEVSDGFHTFNELYQHRHMLLCAFASFSNCWKSKNHWINGELVPVWDGWFLAGVELFSYSSDRELNITYHLPLDYWDLFEGLETDNPPAHDGHTGSDVLDRLRAFITRTL